MKYPYLLIGLGFFFSNILPLFAHNEEIYEGFFLIYMEKQAGVIRDYSEKSERALASATEKLINLKDKSVHVLLPLLEEKDPFVYQRAFYILGEIGEKANEATPQLIEKLETLSLEDQKRKIFFQTLGKIGEPLDLLEKQIERSLESPLEKEQKNAWQALIFMNKDDLSLKEKTKSPEESLSLLEKILAEEKGETQIRAAVLLAKLYPNEEKTLPLFQEALQSPNPNHVLLALEYLPPKHIISCQEQLKELSTHSSEKIQEQARLLHIKTMD